MNYMKESYTFLEIVLLFDYLEFQEVASKHSGEANNTSAMAYGYLEGKILLTNV